MYEPRILNKVPSSITNLRFKKKFSIIRKFRILRVGLPPASIPCSVFRRSSTPTDSVVLNTDLPATDYWVSIQSRAAWTVLSLGGTAWRIIHLVTWQIILSQLFSQILFRYVRNLSITSQSAIRKVNSETSFFIVPAIVSQRTIHCTIHNVIVLKSLSEYFSRFSRILKFEN